MSRIHPVFHVLVLQHHKPDTITGRRTELATPIMVEGEMEWEVEEVLDCRQRGKRREYLVSWKGFGPEENLWEPEANLDNCAKALEDFNKKTPRGGLKTQAAAAQGMRASFFPTGFFNAAWGQNAGPERGGKPSKFCGGRSGH
jgi:hypothetical protein